MATVTRNKIKNFLPFSDSNLFVRRREEHKLLYKHLMNLDSYEKRFKMLEIAYNKIFEVIQENRDMLRQLKFDEKSLEFPTRTKTFESLSTILENTCLFGDLILHVPDISYVILAKRSSWRPEIDWSIQFTLKRKSWLDPITVKMLSILNQELNETERSPDYVNPYYENVNGKKDKKEQKKDKKIKKKLRKGPQLYSGKNEL